MLIVYVAVLVAANLALAKLGPQWSPVIAFLLIGLDLSLRDRIHDKRGGVDAIIAVLLAAVISLLIDGSATRIAVASFIAFAAAGLTDTVAYELLRRRPALVKMNGSNVAGALVDSALFPTIAFGALMPEIIAAQFVAKVAGGAMWAWLLTRRA